MDKRSMRSKEKADLAGILRKSWYHLRLSVRHQSRVPTWDAIVLTAASPEQAELYEWQLRRAKHMGRIANSMVTLAVPDQHGQRIGFGAATLNAIYALACHYRQLGFDLAGRWQMELIVDLDLCLMKILKVKFFSQWLAPLPKGIYCCFMREVTLKGSHGQILWGKFFCHSFIWLQMTPMGQYPYSLTTYLQFLLAQDNLLEMNVICPVCSI